MMQLQDNQKGLNGGREASEREQALEAQLVEARSIISEQVRYAVSGFDRDREDALELFEISCSTIYVQVIHVFDA